MQDAAINPEMKRVIGEVRESLEGGRELSQALARHPRGLTGDELVAVAYDEPVSAVTVRAELSRLRRRLGPVVSARPYRLLIPCVLPEDA